MSENILEVKGLTKDYGDFVLDKYRGIYLFIFIAVR